MAAGLAIRIAQNICCHAFEESLTSDPDRLLRQKVWASCVALEKQMLNILGCTSWALGKSSALAAIPLLNRPAIPTGNSAELCAWELELHEIGTQIQNNLAARLGLPRLYQQDEYHVIVVQLDGCLTKWEESPPDDWKLSARAERYSLHFRLYLMKSRTTAIASASDSSIISDRLLQECARICLEVTSLIAEIQDPSELMIILPWWYRVYYLRIAGTHFLAAMFASNLFTLSIEQSFYQVLTTLKAHEHLSLNLHQCAQTFKTLSTRILNTRCSNSANHGAMPLDEAASGLFLYNIFQDVNFDLDDFLNNT
ncbi:Sorbicillinoid biosynthetic cluster transcription factor sor3 [Metarhizium anisopliae]|nr:Sorbicillinoid biosynthetic cluster transcription factor sor3 [Metarhizium anisopliae]